MSWLRDEMDAAMLALQQKHVARLGALGISDWPQLTEVGAIGIVRCTPAGPDLYEPTEEGVVHLAVAVTEDDTLVDIVAFRPEEPDSWLLRTGNGWALGADQIRYAQGGWSDRDGTLKMFATPLDWLRGGREGACIIDGYSWQAATEVRAVRALEVDSPLLARALRLQLSKPPSIPEIHIRGGARHAA